MKSQLHVFIYRMALNFWPCIRGTGGRIIFIEQDFTKLVVKLPLSWRTWNRVGTIFGGSMYASTDPFFMLMLMEILGPDYVVWDKGATIRFKRPAKETLYTEFLISPERLKQIHEAMDTKGEESFTWTIELKSKAQVVHAEIDKVVYVAKKEFYKQKLKARAST